LARKKPNLLLVCLAKHQASFIEYLRFLKAQEMGSSYFYSGFQGIAALEKKDFYNNQLQQCKINFTSRANGSAFHDLHPSRS
jgi:hypothetical protein